MARVNIDLLVFQEENRAYDPKYYFNPSQAGEQKFQEESRGKKRARAEDFL